MTHYWVVLLQIKTVHIPKICPICFYLQLLRTTEASHVLFMLWVDKGCLHLFYWKKNVWKPLIVNYGRKAMVGNERVWEAAVSFREKTLSKKALERRRSLLKLLLSGRREGRREHHASLVTECGIRGSSFICIARAGSSTDSPGVPE
jgi:hypothetical protein